ncbi:MAG: hypothetical protein HKL96_10230 [Phycisphaerales bacterium]|nr:hypothetical protein [Phycisphaerales bacterium]
MSHSLSKRLIFTSAAASGVVMMLMGVALYMTVAHILRRQFDHVLLARATAIAAGVDWDNNNGHISVRIESDAPLPRRYRGSHEQGQVFVWTKQGQLVYQSSQGFSPVKPREATYPAFHTLTLAHQQRAREVVVPLQADGGDSRDGSGKSGGKEAGRSPPPGKVGGRALLAVVQSLDPLNDILQTMLVAVALSCALATGLLAVVLALIARQSLRPLRDLAANIGRVGIGTLAEQVAVPQAPSELEPVINRLNELLSRVQSAFERERLLTADVAHELRTPLAGIQTTLELSLTRHRDEASYRQTIERSLGIAHRMQTMIANLLTLTRAEAGQMRLVGEAFDVGQAVNDALAEQRGVLDEKGVTVTITIPEKCVISTDRTAAELVLRNVMENAASYVDRDGCVEVSVHRRGKVVVISLANTGSQVSAPDAAHVFERFWRGDMARSGDGAHCGLGLALVQRLMAVLGGSVQARSQQGGRFEIELMFQDLGAV